MNNSYLMLIEKQIEKTSASDSMRGYYYQILVTIKWWLELYNKKIDYKIYCEVEDDLKIEEGKEVKYVQVKSYKESFTINNRVFKKTICNFYKLYLLNRNKQNSFKLETNSFVGKNCELLKKWAEMTISEEKKFELSNIFKGNMEKALGNKIEDSEEDFFKFFNMIDLNFKNEKIEECLIEEKKRIFCNMDKINVKSNKDIILGGLIQEVLEKSVEKDINKKFLNNENIKPILEIEKEEEVKEKFMNIVKEIKTIEDNSILVKVRSRKKGESSDYELNLTKFFEIGDNGDEYKRIKKHSYWNNEIIKEIDNFFHRLDENNKEKDSDYILIDLKYNHYSIIFYIAHTYNRTFKEILPVESKEIYYDKSNEKSCISWNVDKLNLEKGQDIVAIINPSLSTKTKDEVVNNVKKFIEGEGIEVSEIINFTLPDNSSKSINGGNVYQLADQIEKELHDYQNRIHLFFTGPTNLTFIIGKKMSKKSKITIYETLKYAGVEVDGKCYTDGIIIG